MHLQDLPPWILSDVTSCPSPPPLSFAGLQVPDLFLSQAGSLHGLLCLESSFSGILTSPPPSGLCSKGASVMLSLSPSPLSLAWILDPWFQCNGKSNKVDKHDKPCCNSSFFFFSFQQTGDGIKTKQELTVNKEKLPGRTPPRSVVQRARFTPQRCF